MPQQGYVSNKRMCQLAEVSLCGKGQTGRAFGALAQHNAKRNGSAFSNTNQHFLTTIQCDLLTSVESRGA
jgi:hypothetical protein